jgi:hypothetical protein
MSFTVTWVPGAESELAELWMATTDRDRVELDDLLVPVLNVREFPPQQ